MYHINRTIANMEQTQQFMHCINDQK